MSRLIDITGKTFNKWTVLCRDKNKGNIQYVHKDVNFMKYNLNQKKDL